MRGRPPKPTNLRLIQGNPGHRPVNTEEPIAPPEIPSPPDFLSARAVEEWNRLAPLLKDSGLISNLDRNAFASYCEAFALWANAIEDVVKTGKYQRSPSGRIAISKAVELADMAERRMTAIGAEFGLSPSARSRIKLGEQTPADEFERYLKNGPAPG